MVSISPTGAVCKPMSRSSHRNTLLKSRIVTGVLLATLLSAVNGMSRADDLVSVFGLALDSDPQYQASIAAHAAALEAVPKARRLAPPHPHRVRGPPLDRADL